MGTACAHHCTQCVLTYGNTPSCCQDGNTEVTSLMDVQTRAAEYVKVVPLHSMNGVRDDKDFGAVEETIIGHPAGTVFPDTTQLLGKLEQDMLYFAATPNLVAVRWLLLMGADWHAKDTNGTTCLHVACRAGTTCVIREFLKCDGIASVRDNAGWTPLHIAAFMGRHDVVCLLLEAGSSVGLRTKKGQLAWELSADRQTRTTLRDFMQGVALSHTGEALNTGQQQLQQALLYEPFFVPRDPIRRYRPPEPVLTIALSRLAMHIFNQQPGYGLAFVVALDLVQDYPAELARFLQTRGADPVKVGDFLGEAFSLSCPLRYEFINLLDLEHTGVVGALAETSRKCNFPEELQKLNRLVFSVARIWWRKHELLEAGFDGVQFKQDSWVSIEGPSSLNGGDETYDGTPMDEVMGLELKREIKDLEGMYQLMLSTALLHRHVHGTADGTDGLNFLSYEEWHTLNPGIGQGLDFEARVEKPIYLLVSQASWSEMIDARGPSDRLVAIRGGTEKIRPQEFQERDGDPKGDPMPERTAPMSGLAAPAPNTLRDRTPPGPKPGRCSNVGIRGSALESWVVIVNGTFPTEAASNRKVDPLRVAGESLDSRVTSRSSCRSRGDPPRGCLLPLDQVPRMAPLRLWASVLHGYIFFSTVPESAAPYAFLSMTEARVAIVDPERRRFSLVGQTESLSTAEQDACLSLVLLLPDGRWQDIAFPELTIELSKEADFWMWNQRLAVEKGITPSHVASV